MEFTTESMTTQEIAEYIFVIPPKINGHIFKLIDSEEKKLHMVDIFNILLEITINGFIILLNNHYNYSGTRYDIFDVEHVDTVIISEMANYMKPFGVIFKFDKYEVKSANANEYKSYEDYYCEITKNNPEKDMTTMWIVGTYRITLNRYFGIPEDYPIEYYRCLLRNTKGSFFTFHFEIKN